MSSVPMLGSLPLQPSSDNDAGLPAELERIIVELAAQAYPQTWLTLLYVCKRFHQWVEPYLYTRISVTPANLASFLQHPLKHKRTCALFRTRCESLCVFEGVDYFDSLPVLYALSSPSKGSCRNGTGSGIVLKELSYWATKPSSGPLCSVQKELPFPFPQIIQLASSQSSHPPSSSSFPNPSPNASSSSHPAPSPLERLSISIQSGVFPSSGNSFVLPSSLRYSLANLTHLEVLLPRLFSPPPHPSYPTHIRYQSRPLGSDRLLFTGYHHLPALTHLAINSWGSVEDVSRILKECDRGARGGGWPIRLEDRRGVWGGGGGKEGYEAEDVGGGGADEGQRGGEGECRRGLKVLVLLASSHGHAKHTRELLDLLVHSPPSVSPLQTLGNGNTPHKSHLGADPRVVVLPTDQGNEDQDQDSCCEGVVKDDITTAKEGRRKTWDRWAEAEEVVAMREREWERDSLCSWGTVGGKREMDLA